MDEVNVWKFSNISFAKPECIRFQLDDHCEKTKRLFSFDNRVVKIITRKIFIHEFMELFFFSSLISHRILFLLTKYGSFPNSRS